jgi:hypothetical protein
VIVGKNANLKVAAGGNKAMEDKSRKALGAAEDVGLVVQWVREWMQWGDMMGFNELYYLL